MKLEPPGPKELVGAGVSALLILPTLYAPGDEAGVKLRVILIDLSLPFLILLGGILIVAWIARLSAHVKAGRADLLRSHPGSWLALPLAVIFILVGLWFRFA